jgi:hypothetical protein
MQIFWISFEQYGDIFFGYFIKFSLRNNSYKFISRDYEISTLTMTIIIMTCELGGCTINGEN